VDIKEDGRNRFCFADQKPLKEVNKWMLFSAQFWGGSSDDFGCYFGWED